MGFPHPLRLPPPRLYDQVLLRMFPAACHELLIGRVEQCAISLAPLDASPCVTVSSKCQKLFAVQRSFVEIASCWVCAATVNEMAHTQARLLEGMLEPHPVLHLSETRPSQALPSLRCSVSSARNCSWESGSSVSVKIMKCKTSCCHVPQRHAESKVALRCCARE